MHKPTRTPRLPWREIDGRAIVLQPAAGKVHELNPVATLLWRLSDGTRTLDQLSREVAGLFEVTESAALEDARGFVSSLSRLGLLAPDATGEA